MLLTHIHPDHSNGLVDDSGGANYPNADVIVHREDLRNLRSTVTHQLNATTFENAAWLPPNARLHLTATARGGQGGEIFAGITVHPQPGHTPGHTGWLISSRDDALLIWGDIIHVAGVQFERPDATLTFDLDPDMAASRARTRVLDWVATDRIRVAGAHLDFPATGTSRAAAQAIDLRLRSDGADGARLRRASDPQAPHRAFAGIRSVGGAPIPAGASVHD